ncbi:MAG: SIR2 family protein [bacterium]
MGTGITSAIHRLATITPEEEYGKAPQGMGKMDFSVFKEQMETRALESARKTGRGEPNIEDQIRVANDLISGLEIYLSSQDDNEELKEQLLQFKGELQSGLSAFAKDVLTTERNIALSDRLESTMDYLIDFLVSFCSRCATRERLNLFTTNYDRLIEFGAELAGVRLIDRFVGSLNPVFRASRLEVDLHYNPPGIRGEPRYLEGVVHYTKLHGSLDWINQDNIIRRFALPFGVDKPIDQFFPEMTPPGEDKISHLMIYPNAGKDRETSEYPYVELFRDLASALCRPNATLVVYGYGFGDDHINRVIRDMLTIPSTHLVIIAFSDEGDRTKRFYDSVRPSAQITVLSGSYFGDLKNLVDYYLPKTAIDRVTHRMADLLKNRGLTVQSNHTDESGQS